MSDFAQHLEAVNDQLNRASNDIISKVKTLRTRDYMTEEDKSQLEHLHRGAETLLDIVPKDLIEEAQKIDSASTKSTKKKDSSK